MAEMHVKEIPDNLGRDLNILWGERSQFIEGQSLLKKKGKEENFRSLVADCLSTDEGRGMGGLTNEMVRRFSRRARHYVLAYFKIDHEQEKKHG